jgi:predicted metal-dependent peptidase
MSYEKMTLTQRVQAANIDCMRHDKFGLLSSVICMGKSEVTNAMPTAATNGKDKFYGAEFITDMTRKQLRYLVLHENFHCALKHCSNYAEADRINPRVANMAMDYVVNGLIEEMDPELKFVERPTKVAPLVDPKYAGWSFPQVFNDLMKDAKKGGKGEGKGDGQGNGKPTLDEHMPDPCKTDKEREQLARDIDDALRQGELLVRKRAGNGAGGRDVFGLAAERQTDYLSAMREWITAVCQGDDQSRFCPPNKRLLPLGFIMPSHFSESVGELIVAADTSGSMGPIYPVLFGEVARVCQQVRPERVRIIWWDSAVCGEQVFAPHEYDQIGSLLKPSGGGGTVPTAVVEHIVDQRIQAKGILWLTDGYLYCDTPPTPMPSLWGVVDNDSFTASHGKTLHIRSNNY